MRNGLFISIEGSDGSGKSTQMEYIKQYFDNLGMEVVYTREPGGTAIGEKLRNIVLDRDNGEMADMAEALIYAASRAQHVEQIIKPALNKGKTVLCDRFIDSSIAYQGYGRGLGDRVRIINEFAVDGCMPDLTILLLVNPEVGKSRIKADEEDRIEREKIEFYYRVYEGYKKLIESYPDRIIGIDGNQDIESVRDSIYRELNRVIGRQG